MSESQASATPAAKGMSAAHRELEQLVAGFYSDLSRFHVGAQIVYNIHDQLDNLEYLVAITPDVDLAAGVNAPNEPEARARQLLVTYFQLFSFYRPSTVGDESGQRLQEQMLRQRFDSQLFLKHKSSSTMGTHCIFGWRIAGAEAIDYCFVVHLDRQSRVVMVTSVYLPVDVPVNCDLQRAYAAHSRWLAERKGTQAPLAQPVVVRRGSTSYYCLQVKLTADTGDQVRFIDTEGQELSRYSVAFKAGPHRLGVARVFHDFPSHDDGHPYPLAEVLIEPETVPAVLQGLKSNSDLQGRYVVVTDEIGPDSYDTMSAQFMESPDPAQSGSKFDRQMVYYHIDKIQRHFRRIGLDMLDEYEHLNPIRVVLYPSDGRLALDGPLYASNEQRIYITELAQGCTNAREARILYHEFVHAVTDALARLNRHEKVDATEPRALQIWQAAAIDEAIADYFACSLAARNGAADASFYAPPAIEHSQQQGGSISFPTISTVHRTQTLLKWHGASIRKLGGGSRNGYPSLDYDLRCQVDMQALVAGPASAPDTLIYQWAEQWGRYLWALRVKLGADIADTIIAHSIFFMTRWSTFESGVIALELADSMLFGGINHSPITQLGQSAYRAAQPAQSPQPTRA